MDNKGQNQAVINWYPGHMTKARRAMQEDMKLIDLVIEIVDARMPLSSRNPDIDELAKNKSRMILFNKSDLADESLNKDWIDFFEKKGYTIVKINAKNGMGIRNVTPAIAKACEEKIARDLKRGIKNRPVRAMVVGIPNVGKSTFINALAGKACTKTGNKPGVTKGKQWIRLNKNVELLDTPGILWPKFEDQKTGLNLAITGSINDEILDIVQLSLHLTEYIKTNYEGLLFKRYDIDETLSADEILSEIAKRRGCLKKGGELDYEKAAFILLDEFRSGKIGCITLEKP